MENEAYWLRPQTLLFVSVPEALSTQDGIYNAIAYGLDLPMDVACKVDFVIAHRLGVISGIFVINYWGFVHDPVFENHPGYAATASELLAFVGEEAGSRFVEYYTNLDLKELVKAGFEPKSSRSLQVIVHDGQDFADALGTDIESRVCQVFDRIIDAELKSFRKTKEFKVRPGYGYDKFYLDNIDGDYDMSIYGLVHYILYEDELYPEFLNDKQMRDLAVVISEYPESIYRPDEDTDDNYSVVEQILNYAHYGAIEHVVRRLMKEGFDIKDNFGDFIPTMANVRRRSDL